MPLVDITKPEIINFLVESYDKTARLRIRWNTANVAKLRQAATFTSDEKGYFETDVMRVGMEGGMAAITRDFISSGRNRKRVPLRDAATVPAIADLRKGHSIAEVGLGDPKIDPRLARPDTDISIDPIMRPVDPKQREIIYKDLPTYGREAYICQRNRMKPEEKFYFQECGGWIYGWRMKDSFFGRQGGSPHGRVYCLTHGTKSRTGPQPDPTHYKSSDPPGPSKCIAE